MVTYSADRMYGARDAFSSPATFLHSRKPQVLSLLNLQTLRIDFGNFSGPPQFGFRSKPHTVHAYNPSIVAAPSGLCRRCALVAAIRADVLGQCDSGSLLYDERTFAEFDPEAFFKNTAIAVLDVKLRVIAWTWLISRPKRQVRASLPKGDRSRVAPGAADGYAPPWSNQVFDTRLLNYNGRLLATYVCHACDFSISTVEVTGVETPDGGLGQLRSWASGRLKVHPQWVQGRNQALFVRHDADGGSRLLVQPWIGMVASFGKLKLVTRKLGRPCYLAGAPAAKEDERWYCGTSAPGASTEVHQIKRGFTRHPELLVNQTAALRLRAGLQTRFSPTSNLALVRSGSCAGYLGVAHMHRSNNPVTQAETDTRPLWQRRFSLPRARRRALERVWYEVREGVRRDNHTFKFGSQYTHFWYVLAPEPPHRLLGWSREFCLQSQQDAADCESIQFVSSIQTAPGDTLRVAYGVNDCETKVGVLPLQQVWSSLRPVPADPECEEREGRDGQCCAPGATRIDCFGRTTLSNACDLVSL
jgi:hypothetical protein